ncbi:MAG: stage III sporulation protein AA [Ruminococcaceae bacterium]|nr:stage III sporulation protein AA [Oscillospiraceae bacterium]
MYIDRDIQCFDEAAAALGTGIASALLALPAKLKREAFEIRLRCGRPIAISCAEGQIFPCDGVDVSRAVLDEVFYNLCGHAVYSRESDIARGCITVGSGHRAGICGTAVVSGGTVTALRDISSVNLRIAKERMGCADECMRRLFANGLCGAVIAGSPCSGKTTILRDMAKALSEGRADGIRRRVAVVDEKGELAAVCGGIPCCDVGRCTDVLDGYPRAEGMLQAVRCLSPDVIICDEVGADEDVAAVRMCAGAGAVLIMSVHAGSVDDLARRPQLISLLHTGAFRRVALLCGRSAPSAVAGIYSSEQLLDGEVQLCG